MQIAPNRTPIQNIAALVLAANPTFAQALSAANVFFDSSVDPSVVTPLTGDPTGHNSQITLTAKTDSTLTGATTIKYTRLSITDAASQKTPSLNVPMSQADDQASMTSLLALYAGINPSEVTLSGTYSRPADVSNNPQTTATLTINNGSIVYLDATTLNFTLTWQGKIDIPSQVTQTNMSGFDVTPAGQGA